MSGTATTPAPEVYAEEQHGDYWIRFYDDQPIPAGKKHARPARQGGDR